MIELAEVSFRNFLSFGDYITTIPLTGFNQCLILGAIEETSADAAEFNSSPAYRSNGAGKSACINAILWALFGRTMHDAEPGDSVINWFTGRDCVCTVKFKSGDSITRARNVEGHNELFYVKDGNETKAAITTLATSKIQQRALEEAFHLDWDIFCGAAFFTQYCKPWMEMADPHRKKAIERLLRADRFNYYAEMTKKKIGQLETETLRLRSRLDGTTSTIETLTTNLNRSRELAQQFDASQITRRQHYIEAAKTALEQRNQLQLPELEKLQAKWEMVERIKQTIAQQQVQITVKLRQLNELDAKHRNLQQLISLWHDKSGKICTDCEQPIMVAHVTDKIGPYQAELAVLTEHIETLRQEKQQLEATATQVQQSLVNRQPKLTMGEARALHQRWQQFDDTARRQALAAKEIENEANPHAQLILELEEKVAKLVAQQAEFTQQAARYNLLESHYSYIYKAYNERGRIKSYVFDEYIPYINERLRYYLDAFGLDIQIQLTNALAIKSNLWNYKFQSGGERKRTDVAFMFAMFDLHEYLYGRQSNLIVLDEVDGRMDDHGVDALVTIIKEDLANRAESVVIISHKNRMRHIFPRELVVKRRQRFSYLEE